MLLTHGNSSAYPQTRKHLLTAHTTEATNLAAMCNITEAERAIGNMRIDEDNDSEDEWEKDGDDVDKSQRVLAFDDETNL